MTQYFTKYNHYNPCFWIANWNLEYYDQTINAGSTLQARKQTVYRLNIKSNKILKTKVANVFYQKNLGIAEITPYSMKKFCLKYYPDKFEEFCKDMRKHPETLYMDFEDILKAIEQIAYDPLIKAIRIGKLDSLEHKGLIACFLIIQAMRSYEMMTSMLNQSESIGIDKWEYFWLIKNAWSNKLLLARALTPLAYSKWIFYHCTEFLFPICDSPIMIDQNSILAILSPCLLLEIDLNEIGHSELGIIRQRISKKKYREFQHRTINNTFQDIIYTEPSLLEIWRDNPDFIRRRTLLNTDETQTRLVTEASNRVWFFIEGLGRVPPDFEKQVKHYLY